MLTLNRISCESANFTPESNKSLHLFATIEKLSLANSFLPFSFYQTNYKSTCIKTLMLTASYTTQFYLPSPFQTSTPVIHAIPACTMSSTSSTSSSVRGA